MSTRSLQSIDVGPLPSLAFGSRTPLWWGTLGLITIEAVTFAVFIITYFYAEVVSDVWPPGGINIPHLLLPTVSMAILLVSCVPAYLSTRAARQGDLRRTRIMLLANVILAAIAFAIRIVELHGLNFGWNSNLYASVVWIMMDFHTFDFAAALLETVVFIVIAFTGRLGYRQRLGIEVDSLTWYFVVAVWIPLYVIIYILPNAK